MRPVRRREIAHLSSQVGDQPCHTPVDSGSRTKPREEVTKHEQIQPLAQGIEGR